VTNAPTADADPTENSGNTAFKILVKEELDSLNFYTEASGNTRHFHLWNKTTNANETDNKTERIGTAVGGTNVGYITSYTNVQPGEYIFYNTGFGGGFVGIVAKTIDLPDDPRSEAPISWSTDKVELKLRDAFTAPTFSNPENLPVVFSVVGETATVDENGNIALVEGKVGTTIVSATYTETGEADQYKTTVKDCEISVLSNVTVVTLPAPYEVGEDIEIDADKLFSASGAVDADASLLEDDNITVKTLYSAKSGSYGDTYLGHKFTKTIQVRTAAAPNAENPNGTQQKDCTPVIVTPNTNLTLYVFGRRQAMDVPELTTIEDDVENNVITETHYNGWAVNDGKSLRVTCVDEPTVLIDQEIILGKFIDKDYAYVATKVELEAGKTYTLYAVGTTYGVNGIGYVLPTTPEVPEIEEPASNKNGEGAIESLTFTVPEGYNLYYRYVTLNPASMGETNAPMREAAETLEHEGETYTLLHGDTLPVTEDGTLYYFAHNPETDARSEVKSMAVSGTTALVEISAEAGVVEYYNLQGIRVAAPAEGVYIRKQGDNVSKVYVK
ncbi:MAG: hypothetical protein K2H87_08865, partial [Duncaniella sp.]|nr:hypothetical protein [Duncaniella sp.]